MAKRRSGLSIADKVVRSEDTETIYPQLTRLKDRRKRSRVNKLICDKISYFVHEQRMNQENREFFAGYRIKLNKSGLLSILVEICDQNVDDNEIFTTFRSITLDTKNASLIEFSDLFINKSYYEYIINKLISEQIQKDQTPFIQEFLNIGSNKYFYLTDSAIVVYFPLYRDTRYANTYCTPEFIIPYEKLEGLIDSKGPIPRLLK